MCDSWIDKFDSNVICGDTSNRSSGAIPAPNNDHLII